MPSPARGSPDRDIHRKKPYDRSLKSQRSGWLDPLFRVFGVRKPYVGIQNDGAALNTGMNGDVLSDRTPAEVLSARGHAMIHDLTTAEPNAPDTGPSTPPQEASSHVNGHKFTPSPASTASRSSNIDEVIDFLRLKQDLQLPVNNMETAGIIAKLKAAGIPQPQPEDHHEQFRFSASPSPAQGNSPIALSRSRSQSPRKNLDRNPNGDLRYQGAGSSRPKSRTRIRSPAFGTPRTTPTKIKLSTSLSQPQTDTKRRRVGEDSSTSSAQTVPSTNTTSLRSPAPSPMQTAADTSSFIFPVSNGSPSPAVPKLNGHHTRARVFPQKPTAPPTAPAVPSPLRQAWGQSISSPSSSASHSPPHSSPCKPTKAADFMTELLKEVTPSKKPDAIHNPYQTASPVKVPTTRSSTRRARAPPAARKEKEEKQSEPSPQAIIEATVPKGSKRSRPPAHLQRSESPSASSELPHRSQPSPSRRTQLSTADGKSSIMSDTIVVEDMSDDEDSARVGKKQKKANGSATSSNPTTRNRTSTRTRNQTVTVEEVEDKDMPSHKTQRVYSRPSEVIEPSDKGTSKASPAESVVTSSFSLPASTASQTPLTTESPLSSTSNVQGSPAQVINGGKLFGMKSSAPKEPSKLRYSYQPDRPSSPASSLAPSHTEQKKSSSDPKAVAIKTDIDALPVYSFPFKECSNNIDALYHIKAITPQSDAKAAPISTLPTFDFSRKLTSASAVIGFDWGAAGIKPPAKAEGESWKCSTCMLSNPTATDKCTICDSPRL